MRDKIYTDYDEYEKIYSEAQHLFCNYLNKQLGINVKPSDFGDHWYKMDNVISYDLTFEKDGEEG